MTHNPMTNAENASTVYPPLVLLHGAGLGSWIWDPVIPHLNVPVEALDLPGRVGTDALPRSVTLQHAIDAVHDRLHGPSIVVGHSFSAEVALGVAAAHPASVAGVVLVGGVVPRSGRSFMSLLPYPQRVFLHLLLRLNRNGIRLPTSLVKSEYCSDLDAEQSARVLERIVPEAPRLYLDALNWSDIPDALPRFYVKLLRDKSVPLKQQDEAIGRIRATGVESIDAGHLPMLSRPQETAAALTRLVEAIAAFPDTGSLAA